MSPSTSRSGRPRRPPRVRVHREAPRANPPALADEGNERRRPVPEGSGSSRGHPAVEVGVVPGADRSIQVRRQRGCPRRGWRVAAGKIPARTGRPARARPARDRRHEQPRLLVVERIGDVDPDAGQPLPVGRERRRARVAGQADQLPRFAPGCRNHPDRRAGPRVRARTRVGGVGDPAAVGRPGDPPGIGVGMGQLAGPCPVPRRDDPDLVPPVAVADLVRAPVGPRDPSRGDDPALRLGADDPRATGSTATIASRDPSGDQASSLTPCPGTQRTLGSPPSRPASMTAVGRPASSGNARRNASRRPSGLTRGAVSRTAARRQGPGRPCLPEVDELQVRPIRLRVHEATDDDRARAVGERDRAPRARPGAAAAGRPGLARGRPRTSGQAYASRPAGMVAGSARGTLRRCSNPPPPGSTTVS